jgi:hypothetical protein
MRPRESRSRSRSRSLSPDLVRTRMRNSRSRSRSHSGDSRDGNSRQMTAKKDLDPDQTELVETGIVDR